MTKLSRSPDVAAFLLRARDAGVITQQTFDVLADFVRSGEADLPTRSTQPTTRPSTSPPAQPEAPDPVEVSAAAAAIAQPSAQAKPLPKAAPPRLEPIPPPPRPPRPPSQWRIRAEELRSAIVSDVAVHGFSYLGVVLTFVGVLGFLLFAFVDLPNATQPFVELFIAAIFFGWAWWLRRQQAIRVAQGMELIGGMILPLVVFAGLVDGAPVPPDFTGSALVAALPAVSTSARSRLRPVQRHLPHVHASVPGRAAGLAGGDDVRVCVQIGRTPGRGGRHPPRFDAAGLGRRRAGGHGDHRHPPPSVAPRATDHAGGCDRPPHCLPAHRFARRHGGVGATFSVGDPRDRIAGRSRSARRLVRSPGARPQPPADPHRSRARTPSAPPSEPPGTGLVAVVTYLTLFEANKWVTGGLGRTD